MGLMDMFNTGGINYGNSYIPEGASDEYRAMMGAAPKNSIGQIYDSQSQQGVAQAATRGNQVMQAAAAPAAQATLPAASGHIGEWDFSNGGLTQQQGIKAPTYNGMNDPALAMTLQAGGQGMMSSGLGAFLSPTGNNYFNAANNDITGKARYNMSDMQNLASGFGWDTSQYKDPLQLQDYLDNQLKDYSTIRGLSEGWNPTGDARGANSTIYKNVNGQLVPYQTNGFHAREVGGYIKENPGVLAPLGVAAGGLLAAYAGGAGAGAAAGGASGAAPAAGAAGATAAPASTGWLGSLANYAGLGSQFGALPGYAQAGLQGALQGSLTSAATGGNPLMGALTGGLTGGLTPGVNSALSGLGGLPGYATNAIGAGGLGALTQGISGGNPLMGALGGSVSSGIGGGLAANGVNPAAASILGRVGGQTATGLAQGRDLSSLFSPQQIAMLAANPSLLRALFG